MAFIRNNTFINRYQQADGERLNIKGYAEYLTVQTGQEEQIISNGIPTGTNFGDYLYWNGSSYSSGGDNSIVLGSFSGQFNQQTGAIAIGNSAGNENQSEYAIAIGNNAGNTEQSGNAIAIGNGTGYNDQGTDSIAIGFNAAEYSQNLSSISIGNSSGFTNQGENSIAIGFNTGRENQKDYCVAIGALSGGSDQGTTLGYNIALGAYAFFDTGPYNSICINASGQNLNEGNTGALYINPIRTDNSTFYKLKYNNQTSEITASSILSSQATMTGVPNSSSEGIVLLQTLNLPAPSSNGSYYLNIQYNLYLIGTFLNKYIFYVQDSNNGCQGASYSTTFPSTTNQDPIGICASGLMNVSSTGQPFVYNMNSVQPSLNLYINDEQVGGFSTQPYTGLQYRSNFQAWYIPA